MPRITTFIYSEDSKLEMTPNGTKGIVINPFASLLPQFIPGVFSFNVSIGIQDLEQRVEHKLTYLFLKKGEELPVINPLELPFRVEHNPETQHIPDYYQGLIFNLEFKNIVLRTNGEYLSRVYVNDELLGEYPISVYGKENL